MIYFVMNKRTSDIKIGFTDRSIEERLKEFATTINPSDLIVLGTREGSQQDESALHAKYSAHKAWGEWFFASRDLLLEALCLGQPAPRTSVAPTFSNGITIQGNRLKYEGKNFTRNILLQLIREAPPIDIMVDSSIVHDAKQIYAIENECLHMLDQAGEEDTAAHDDFARRILNRIVFSVSYRYIGAFYYRHVSGGISGFAFLSKDGNINLSRSTYLASSVLLDLFCGGVLSLDCIRSIVSKHRSTTYCASHEWIKMIADKAVLSRPQWVVDSFEAIPCYDQLII